MFDIGHTTNESTPEFTIYKTDGGPEENYLIELDGKKFAICGSVEVAHALIKKTCRDDLIKAAGVTEAFGRNRQFITTNRYAFKTYKGD